MGCCSPTPCSRAAATYQRGKSHSSGAWWSDGECEGDREGRERWYPPEDDAAGEEEAGMAWPSLHIFHIAANCYLITRRTIKYLQRKRAAEAARAGLQPTLQTSSSQPLPGDGEHEPLGQTAKPTAAQMGERLENQTQGLSPLSTGLRGWVRYKKHSWDTRCCGIPPTSACSEQGTWSHEVLPVAVVDGHTGSSQCHLCRNGYFAVRPGRHIWMLEHSRLAARPRGGGNKEH
ncbi:hypothetical protein EK904_007576 [Melospiza melodia maxima]|nr:hypothetical protein EK904_007576 [Melospiza melodia maxima]